MIFHLVTTIYIYFEHRTPIKDLPITYFNFEKLRSIEKEVKS